MLNLYQVSQRRNKPLTFENKTNYKLKNQKKTMKLETLILAIFYGVVELLIIAGIVFNLWSETRENALIMFVGAIVCACIFTHDIKDQIKNK